MSPILKLNPQALIPELRKKGIRRFGFTYDPATRKVQASHSELAEVAEFLQNDPRDFMAHEGLFFQLGSRYDVLYGAFLHGTKRGQGQGGTRFWYYETFEDFIRDGLRLSKGMTRKNALAGLWWGGGKGVISQNSNINTKDPAVRAEIFREYGEFVTSLRGCYITAEDVGTNTVDMGHIFERTRFMTCIPQSVGGSGNPSEATARGVIRGMEAACKFLDGGSLAGRKVVVQGMGNVGGPVIRFLFEKGVKEVVACDIDPELVRSFMDRYGSRGLKAQVVGRGDLSVLSEPCDIVAPCATGAILNSKTIPLLKTKIVCGAANNQLEDTARDDRALKDRNILYVPDFLVNRMGIVNCANEQYGYVFPDPFVERHLDTDWEQSVYQMTLKVLGISKTSGDSPDQVATRLADELSQIEHPIFGHRGAQIVQTLVREKWATQLR